MAQNYSFGRKAREKFSGQCECRVLRLGFFLFTFFWWNVGCSHSCLFITLSIFVAIFFTLIGCLDLYGCLYFYGCFYLYGCLYLYSASISKAPLFLKRLYLYLSSVYCYLYLFLYLVHPCPLPFRHLLYLFIIPFHLTPQIKYSIHFTCSRIYLSRVNRTHRQYFHAFSKWKLV